MQLPLTFEITYQIFNKQLLFYDNQYQNIYIITIFLNSYTNMHLTQYNSKYCVGVMLE